MSANSYARCRARCPKCWEIYNADLKVVKQQYGKISAEDYEARMDAVVEPDEATVREDYEIGIYGHKFFINYHGKCRVCGFTKKFKHEEKL